MNKLTIFNRGRGGLLTLLFCLLLNAAGSLDAHAAAARNEMPAGNEAIKVKQKRSTSVSHMKKKKSLAPVVKSSFENPDFAFPADVRRDAEPVFLSAIKDKDGAKALTAAMELAVADRLTSRDSIGSIIARYQCIAGNFGEPWNSLASLLIAKQLNSTYNADFWKFNRRELPTDSISPEPMLWSGLQFRKEIDKAVKEALRESDVLARIPIGEIASVLTDVKDAEAAEFSVLDFVTAQVVGLLPDADAGNASIPFRQLSVNGVEVADSINSVSQSDEGKTLTADGLLDSLIDYDERRGDAAAGALFQARLTKMRYCREPDYADNPELIVGYPKELLSLYPENSKFRAALLINLFLAGRFNTSDAAKSRQLYLLLHSAANGDCSEAEREVIKGILARLTQPSYNLSTPAQWLASQHGEIELRSHNIRDAYLLLVPVSPGQAEGEAGDKLMNVNLRASGKVRPLLHIVNSDNMPVDRTDTVRVQPLKAGYYALVMSETPDLTGIFEAVKRSRCDIILVSDLNVFTSDASSLSDGRKETARYLYVVDGKNNSPIGGAGVNFISTSYKQRGLKSSAVTDKDGKVRIPFDQCRALITRGDDRLIWNGGTGYVSGPREERISASVLTDLALYHPGDTIQAAVVVSRCKDNILSVGDDKKFKLRLRDANYKEVENIELVTDRFGRACGVLHIPAEGLTGRFTIQALDGDLAIGSASVEVAEYKAPTFRVVLDAPQQNNGSSDNVRNEDEGGDGSFVLSGTVLSYSGMPLADAQVTLDISFMPWWRPWMQGSNLSGNYDVRISSDSNGRFTTVLALSKEDAVKYQFGRFIARAIATSAAGETQESDSKTFSVGEGYSVEFRGATDIEVKGDEIILPVSVKDILGNPVSKELRYRVARISRNGETPDFSTPVIKGEFKSPDLRIPSSKLPSGLYVIQAILEHGVRIIGGEKEEIWRPDTLQQEIVIMRQADRRPPMETGLWIPRNVYYSRPGESHVDVTVGASYTDNYVFCQIAGKNGTIRREWLRPSGENIKIKVDAPKDGEIIRLYFAGCRDLKVAENFVTIYPPQQSRTTVFRIDTFRDRLTPGSEETWRFRLLSGWPEIGKGGEPGDLPESSYVGDGAVIAVLSNQALDAITPFKWNFTPGSLINYTTLGGVDYPWMRTLYSLEMLSKTANIDYSTVGFTFPAFRFSDAVASNGIMVRGAVHYKMQVTSAPVSADGAVEEIYEEAPMLYASASADRVYDDSDKAVLTGSISNMSAKKESNALSEEEVESEEGSNPVNRSEDSVDLRSMEMPLAFFRPLLTTDQAGYTTIEFNVPNFNTTWNLQLLGYDKNLNSALLRESAVAAKPVMVSTAMPRFLLTGDRAQITATVFNNTERTLLVDTQIEIFDIATGNIIASESTGKTEFMPGASGLATITFNVPDDMSQLGVRTVAVADSGSDGEQGVLAVFPSSTPVSDATTFYLNVGCEEKSITLPVMNPSDKVTLNFCNNPEWFVLTALSGNLEPDSESALVQAVALYSNCVASGLLHSHDGLKKGLNKMLATNDSALISPLQKDESLRLASLGNTPWVNNAESETARMQSLSTLLDDKMMGESLASRIEGLAKTYNSDGSWSWMKGMPGSMWITEQVLDCMGQLRYSGYLPDDKRLRSMLGKGVKFTDAEMSKDYNEIVRKHRMEYPLAAEIQYLYMRSNVAEDRPGATIAEMNRDMLRRLPSEWRNLSLMQKATAAILLKREGGSGRLDLAREILESVKQFSTCTPDKGRWFDGLSGDLLSPSPLMLTARCLDAYREVDPGNDAIPGFEQYLILSRQTRDWNLELGEAGVATVVNSILCNDAALGMADAPEVDNTLTVALGGREIHLPVAGDNLPGNFYVNLDPVEASGTTLTIHRHGATPSWGGVVSQYIAPIKDVKAHSVPQLMIEKSLLPVSAGTDGRKVGKDSFVFRKGDRVRVTLTLTSDRDLDYVLITDRLGAWMQPAAQLTEYMAQDGLWMLRETRKADVNFFITRMPKGKYVISYEINADRDGEYSSGIAVAQSQYYPLITAHTAGRVVKINN